ncbi:hypothetical protein [Paraburkholderia acidicola]|uniref:hypothetical protein n=1 Tax=Paraburkholderia acidicola TaxID=1912599 RepID=UPI0010557A02|nr:hypothetical protein [Paraburkholderia acidicola]
MWRVIDGLFRICNPDYPLAAMRSAGTAAVVDAISPGDARSNMIVAPSFSFPANDNFMLSIASATLTGLLNMPIAYTALLDMRNVKPATSVAQVVNSFMLVSPILEGESQVHFESAKGTCVVMDVSI